MFTFNLYFFLTEHQATGESGYKQVTELFRVEKTKLIHLTVGEEEIITTEEHPFWVDGYGFMEAGELTEGYYVENAKGELLLLSKVEEEYLKNPVTVYNFEVEDWHTYYVSGEEIFVHNMCAEVNNVKRQTPDQKALKDLSNEAVKVAKKEKPISYEEAKILDEWAMEYNVPQHHQAIIGSGEHFPGGNYMDHTHIYNVHVPYVYNQ